MKGTLATPTPAPSSVEVSGNGSAESPGAPPAGIAAEVNLAWVRLRAIQKGCPVSENVFEFGGLFAFGGGTPLPSYSCREAQS